MGKILTDHQQSVKSINIFPVNKLYSMVITKKTAKDQVLPKLVTCIHHGSWPSPAPDDVIPYHHQRLELAMQDGCIFWRKCVVISKVLRAKLLEELHIGYTVICQVKASLARSHLWWSYLDKGVETMATQCEACKITVAVPAQAAHHPSPMAVSKYTVVEGTY